MPRHFRRNSHQPNFEHRQRRDRLRDARVKRQRPAFAKTRFQYRILSVDFGGAQALGRTQSPAPSERAVPIERSHSDIIVALDDFVKIFPPEKAMPQIRRHIRTGASGGDFALESTQRQKAALILRVTRFVEGFSFAVGMRFGSRNAHPLPEIDPIRKMQTLYRIVVILDRYAGLKPCGRPNDNVARIVAILRQIGLQQNPPFAGARTEVFVVCKEKTSRAFCRLANRLPLFFRATEKRFARSMQKRIVGDFATARAREFGGDAEFQRPVRANRAQIHDSKENDSFASTRGENPRRLAVSP